MGYTWTMRDHWYTRLLPNPYSNVLGKLGGGTGALYGLIGSILESANTPSIILSTIFLGATGWVSGQLIGSVAHIFHPTRVYFEQLEQRKKFHRREMGF